MADILVPKLNANDLTYVVVEWLVADGAAVRTDDPVVEVETSKAIEELTAPVDGYLHRCVDAGKECGVGDVIGRVLTTADPTPPQRSAPPPPRQVDLAPPRQVDLAPLRLVEPASLRLVEPAPPRQVAPSPQHRGVVITDPARRLMLATGVSTEQVAALGRRLVRRADVSALHDGPDYPAGPTPEPAASTPPASPPAAPVAAAPAAAAPASEAWAGQSTQPLSSIQRTVAATVTESHRTVPAAFAAVKVQVDGATRLAAELTRRSRCLVGLPELLIKAVASLQPRFQSCFGRLDGDVVHLADGAHVGVTIDVGTGLQVPVIRDAATRSWRELGTSLMQLRVAALRGGLRAQDLMGANILVALHNDTGVTVAVPLVFPGQVCAVSLADVHPELTLDPAGGITTRTCVQVGLAYDHRVINGRDAVLFLQALKESLEDPQILEHLG